MNKITKAILVCLALLVIGIIYKETSIYNERLHIFEELQRAEKQLIRYKQMLSAAEKLKRKYTILKKRGLNDAEVEDVLSKVEKFLKNAESIKIKYVKLREDHNRLAESYNILSQQFLLYHGSLPKKLSPKHNISLEIDAQ